MNQTRIGDEYLAEKLDEMKVHFSRCALIKQYQISFITSDTNIGIETGTNY